ncbi:coronin-1C-like isoform X2 [Amphiura filiformis]|uniref:coronin-1C-like isoform X2 n=1 Tax=Amphiura filiformis TaxID=82378 RepID=UPI003B214A24
MAFVRSSKYRHIYGAPFKTDQCFTNIRVSRNNWDGNFCAVNPKFVAVVTEASGGGSFMVLKHEETGRVDLNHAQVCGHKNVVLDRDWNAFNDNIIASASEDQSIKIWMIPDEGIQEEPLIDPIVDLQYHQACGAGEMASDRISNILFSVGADPCILIWNAEEGVVVTEITCHPELIFYATWNYNGSLIATTCKDKKIRIIDPRTGEVKKEGPGHDGAKVSRVQFLKNNKLFTTGFSRMSERQYGVFDATSLSNLAMETIDNNNAPLTICYDPDINLVYLIGKGDTLIRYYEVSDASPYAYWLNNYQSTVPQRCCGMMPKRALNVNNCEVARIYKIIQKGTCEPIAMIVPRKSDLFQEDIYPDTQGDEPSLSASEWVEGKNKDPILISLKDGYVSTRQKSEVRAGGLKAQAQPNKLAALSKKPSAAAVTSAPAATKASTPAANASATNGSTTTTNQRGQVSALKKRWGQGSEMSELRAEIDKLKELVKKQDARIQALESKA